MDEERLEWGASGTVIISGGLSTNAIIRLIGTERYGHLQNEELLKKLERLIG